MSDILARKGIDRFARYLSVSATKSHILASLAAKFSGVAALDSSWPSLDVVGRCALVAVTASTAHWLAYIGTAEAGAARVAPAIYVQMLVAVTLGWVAFGDKPDLWTLLGAGLIIAAGLLVWRESARNAIDG